MSICQVVEHLLEDRVWLFMNTSLAIVCHEMIPRTMIIVSQTFVAVLNHDIKMIPLCLIQVKLMMLNKKFKLESALYGCT